MTGAEILILIAAGLRLGETVLQRIRERAAIPVEWQLTLCGALVAIAVAAVMQHRGWRIVVTCAAIALACVAAAECGAWHRFQIGIMRWVR